MLHRLLAIVATVIGTVLFASHSHAADDFVYVCRDANAGAYEAFPDVCRLKDDRLMCVFYAGYGHVSLPNDQLPKGGRISCCYSNDEGKTWTAAETLYDGPNDDRDPSITQLKDGRLICNFFSLEKTDEKTKRNWRGLGTWMVESSDLGKTWSEPKQISRDYYCSAPIRELADGRLILGLYADQHGAVTISEDKGKTWSKPIDIDNGGEQLDAETDIIELANGQLFAAQRGKRVMCWSTSDDGGKTWTVAESFGFPGHCPYLHRTDDGSIVMAYRLPQTSMRLSRDESATWSDNILVDEFHGAYPSMVNLDDSSVLIVYYEEGEGLSIRAKRFRITDSGVEWLKP